MTSNITASVVLYNTPEVQLSRLLSCIKDSAIVNTVYIIDNSPIPSECDFFELPWIVYLHTGSNVGYGAGHNLALRRTVDSSQFHFVLNPDVFFGSDELRKMIDRMTEDASVGQLMPKVVYPDGSLQYLCKLVPTPVDLLARRFMLGPLKALADKRTQQFELRFTGYAREMDVPYLSGCFMLFRTAALKRVGLFDERFFMYPEDIDISRRMHVQFRTLFFPASTIVHDHARESYKSIRMLWIHIYNLIKYFNKWGWIFDVERDSINARILRSLRS